jgi:predicted RNA-binding protein with PUA-like domain
MKSEPEAYSIDALAKDKVTAWTGVRNFQARNFMKEQMALGDQAFFYHSNCNPPGIVGIVEIAKLAYPDETQFDKKSDYFEPKATRDKPYWYHVDVKFVRKVPIVPLEELRKHKALANMRILQRGNRLSITPVDPREWEFITEKLLR